MQNIEIKYRLNSCRYIKKQLKTHSEIRFAEQVHQRDVYFNVPEGRLKIRFQEGKPAQLIYYFREDKSTARISNYTIETLKDPIRKVKELQQQYGILGQVEKWRELYLFRNVRIHLDNVTHLGWFLEFESVITPETSHHIALQNLNNLQEVLASCLTNPIDGSYINLMLNQKRNPS